MARAEMTVLIGRLRDLVDDNGTTQTWDDNALEAALDRRRLFINQECLIEWATASAAGDSYLRFSSEYSDFEDGVELQDANYATLAHSPSDGEDLADGVWSFDSEPDRPVRVTGWSYDLYGAAADLLDGQLISWATKYDFATNGGDYKRSQAYDRLEKLMKGYKMRQKGYGGRSGGHAVLVRDDVNI